MPVPESVPVPRRPKRLGAFLLKWLAFVGLYSAVVSAGTFVFLLGALAVGYLPYSDRPGPGWGRAILNLQEVRFFLSWFLLLIPILIFQGLILFPFVRALGWLRSPRWVARLFGGLFSGITALIAIMAAGWYIAISEYPVYAGAVSGIIFGAIILPRYAESPEGNGKKWPHWVGIFATILLCGTYVVYPLLPQQMQVLSKQPQQSLRISAVRLVPGPEEIISESGGLDEEDVALLTSLGLSGTIHYGVASQRGYTPTDARAVIVFTEQLDSTVKLPEPKASRVVYVQQGNGWKTFPPDTPTTSDEIVFTPSKTDPTKIEMQSGSDRASPFSFSWYPPLGYR